MTTANMNPKNLLILAAVGVAAYWFATRNPKGKAQTGLAAGKQFFTSPARASVAPGAQPPSIGRGLIAGLSTWFGGTAANAKTLPTNQTRSIANDDLPGQPGYGWQYFTDGTSIGPDGTYYKGGSAVWSPSNQNDGAAVNSPNSYQTGSYTGWATDGDGRGLF